MFGLLFLALVLAVCAMACYRLTPAPLGLYGAIILGAGAFFLVCYAVYSVVETSPGVIHLSSFIVPLGTVSFRHRLTNTRPDRPLS